MPWAKAMASSEEMMAAQAAVLVHPTNNGMCVSKALLQLCSTDAECARAAAAPFA